MGLAFQQGCVFKRFKNCNGFLDVGKEFGIRRSTMNFKMNLMKLLDHFPRLKISSLSLRFCHVKYVFQSEFTLYSCLNVKKLLARSYCGFKSSHSHLPQLLKTPLNLNIWCRIPASYLITHPHHPTIKLLRIQIFKNRP